MSSPRALALSEFKHAPLRSIIAPKKNFSFGQLAGALSLANHFNLNDLQTFIEPAIEEGLNRLDPFECIEAAELYKVQDWLLRPLCRICERYDSLSPSEMGRLGLERSSAVARVREKLIRAGHSAEVLGFLPSSDHSRYDADTIRNKTLRLIEEEPPLSQLLPNGPPSLQTQPLDTSTAFPARFSIGDFISIKVSYLLVFIRRVTLMPDDRSNPASIVCRSPIFKLPSCFVYFNNK